MKIEVADVAMVKKMICQRLEEIETVRRYMDSFTLEKLRKRSLKRVLFGKEPTEEELIAKAEKQAHPILGWRSNFAQKEYVKLKGMQYLCEMAERKNVPTVWLEEDDVRVLNRVYLFSIG